MLLYILFRGDGIIDVKEVDIIEEIAKWIDVNKESVFNTYPWKVFCEGPLVSSNPIKNSALMWGKLNTHPNIFASTGKEIFFIQQLWSFQWCNVWIRALGKNKNNTKI